jgi:hypothetical protein
MSPFEPKLVLESEIDEIRRLLRSVGVSGEWTLYTVFSAWREAQEQATIAYAGWRNAPGAVAYAVYRAAADRADAAQDTLRRCLA